MSEKKAVCIYGVGSVPTKINCFLTVKGYMLGGEGARVVDSDVDKGEKMFLRPDARKLRNQR